MKDYTLKGYSTWKDIMNNSQITDIQDPVLEMEVDKYEFEDMYSDIAVSYTHLTLPTKA